jgi:adenine-specific DNA-methyltransferase
MAKKDYSQLSKEELIAEITQLKKRKKYGIVWEEKEEDVVTQCKKEIPVLTENEDLAITKNPGGPTNILIEGDNYHTLSVLNYTHSGKIDVIFIDPPYNTGNKSWKYNNQYVDKDDEYRHSKWLSFIKQRLSLTRSLLKDDGIFVITIDDYEVFGLGLLLDEVFGENNRIGTVIVENNPRGRTTNTFFATCHEYYIVYAKDVNRAKVENIPLTDDQLALFNLNDDTSNYRLLPFRRSGGLSTPEERPNSYYPIYYSESSKKIDIVEFQNSIKIYPVDSTGRKRVWRQTRPSLMLAVERGDIVIKKNDNKYVVYMKDRVKTGRKPKTIWINSKYDASSNGTVLLQKLLGRAKAFDYPKSLYAVLDFLRVFISKKKEAVVLDYFAGSGTTGHAVLVMNKEDGGNRKYILCTNNENKIAGDVCYPRLKKVIYGHPDFPDITNIKSNLKYYKTAFIPKSHVSDDVKYKLVERSTEMICIREDTYDKVEDKKFIKIFKNNQHYTAILHQLDYFSEFISKLHKLDKEIHIYVFSLTSDTYEEDFKDLKQKYQLCPIPESILQVYKRVFRES